MADVTFATGVFVDAAILTAGNAESLLPISNLQTRQPTKRWRTTSLSTMYIVADLTEAKSINLISLISHNGSASATWRIRGATSEANLTAAPGYDSTAISMWPITKPTDWLTRSMFSRLWLTTAQSYRWWRVDVIDAGNSDGWFEAGRLIIDAAWQPTIGLTPNWGVGWIDPGPREESLGGNLYPTQRARRRLIELNLDFNDETEMLANAFELQRTRGRSEDVLVMVDPTETTNWHRTGVYGLMVNIQPLVNTAFNIFSQTITIEEMI